jgi:chemotaxis regulatin CheY-phosphate phosphatase CheZ
MSEERKIVASVGNEAEAEMVRESLSEAGIRSSTQMSSDGIGLGDAASRDVYVETQDYEAALEALNAAVPSEEELARLSDEAGEESAP